MRSSGQSRQSQGSREGTPGPSQNKRTSAKATSAAKQTEGPANITTTARGTPTQPLSTTNNPSTNGVPPAASLNPPSKPVEGRPMLYKPDPKAQAAAKSEAPWGLKPGIMANGKDFWIELRKQVVALQQSGGTSQGG